MKKKSNVELDFEVDKLTNSIENILSGDSFATEVSIVSISDLKLITKKMNGNLIGSTNINNLNEMFIS